MDTKRFIYRQIYDYLLDLIALNHNIQGYAALCPDNNRAASIRYRIKGTYDEAAKNILSRVNPLGS
jgi:hypothetical protein